MTQTASQYPQTEYINDTLDRSTLKTLRLMVLSELSISGHLADMTQREIADVLGIEGQEEAIRSTISRYMATLTEIDSLKRRYTEETISRLRAIRFQHNLDGIDWESAVNHTDSQTESEGKV